MHLICGTVSALWEYDMEELIPQVIRKYGTQMRLLRNGEEIRIRAFLQSAQSKNWQKMEKEVSPLGEIPGGLYVFIGEPDCAREGDTIALGEELFLLRRLDVVYYADKSAYCWGLCSKKGGEDTWGM